MSFSVVFLDVLFLPFLMLMMLMTHRPLASQFSRNTTSIPSHSLSLSLFLYSLIYLFTCAFIHSFIILWAMSTYRTEGREKMIFNPGHSFPLFHSSLPLLSPLSLFSSVISALLCTPCVFISLYFSFYLSRDSLLALSVSLTACFQSTNNTHTHHQAAKYAQPQD